MRIGSQRGVSQVEYAALLALVVMLSITMATAMGHSIQAAFTNASARIAQQTQGFIFNPIAPLPPNGGIAFSCPGGAILCDDFEQQQGQITYRTDLAYVNLPQAGRLEGPTGQQGCWQGIAPNLCIFESGGGEGFLQVSNGDLGDARIMGTLGPKYGDFSENLQGGGLGLRINGSGTAVTGYFAILDRDALGNPTVSILRRNGVGASTVLASYQAPWNTASGYLTLSAAGTALSSSWTGGGARYSAPTVIDTAFGSGWAGVTTNYSYIGMNGSPGGVIVFDPGGISIQTSRPRQWRIAQQGNNGQSGYVGLFGLSNANAHTGTYSVTMLNQQAVDSWWGLSDEYGNGVRLGVQPGQCYKVDAFIQTHNVAGGGGAYVEAVEYDGNGTPVGGGDHGAAAAISASRLWTESTYRFPASGSTATLDLRLRLSGAGQAWFDSLYVAPVAGSC